MATTGRFLILLSLAILPSCGFLNDLTKPYDPELQRSASSPLAEGGAAVLDKALRDPSPFGLIEALIAGAAAVGTGYVAKKRYDAKKKREAGSVGTPRGVGISNDKPVV